MFPKKLYRLPYDLPLCCWCKDSSLRISTAIFASGTYFPFSGNSNGGNHYEGGTWLKPGQSQHPPPLRCPWGKDGSPAEIRSRAPFCGSTGSSGKVGSRWGILPMGAARGTSCYHKGAACPRTKHKKRKAKQELEKDFRWHYFNICLLICFSWFFNALCTWTKT